MNGNIKKNINRIIDFFLLVVGLCILFAMGREIIQIVLTLFNGLDQKIMTHLISQILTFFLLFEFLIMILRYIEENHHIPLRYLIYISITAVLRQIISSHDDPLNVLFMSISILVLMVTLLVMRYTKYPEKFHLRKK
ncbi:MAG: phosphate-starvation-inducible PsiE family protein [Streptococcaceae bacterium]|jgi:protein PsiE|nr:phosphate-starvation-inducible PsiE family protein [Streptococcaceae bacterium]